MGLKEAERSQLSRLSRSRACPRCDMDKTIGTGLCRKCRTKLPLHMRANLEAIEKRDPHAVLVALRAAAHFFDQHFRSVRDFGGGRQR